MHDTRTCEIQEARRIEEAAAPLPIALHGIDHTCQHDGKQEEGPELHALCDGTGNDRHGRGHEHDLKEEIRQVRVIRRVVAPGDDVGCGVIVSAEHAEARNDAVTISVHDAVTANHVHDACDRVQPDVLGQDFCRVLRAYETGLEHRKSRGHPHDQRTHHEEVERVECVAKFCNIHFSILLPAL